MAEIASSAVEPAFEYAACSFFEYKSENWKIIRLAA